MSLKTALFSYLSTNAAMVAVIGTGAASRLYPDFVPATPGLPYVTYRIVSSQHVRHLLGVSNMCNRRVQFDAFGASALSVEAVFSALSSALEGKRGPIGSENLAVLSSGIETERDEFVDPIDGSQVGKHRRSVDFIIWHRL